MPHPYGLFRIDLSETEMQIVLMIICICRRLNDEAVREAVRAGARCPDSVQSHHGCEFNCGKCRNTIGETIARELDDQNPSLAVAAE